MEKGKNLIYISLLPGLLTLLFISYVVFPSISNMNKADEELKSEKASFEETKEKLSIVNENNQIKKDVSIMSGKLFDFDIRVPEKDDLAILLIDFENFAKKFNVKITGLNSKPETLTNLESVKREKEELKNKNKKKKARKKKKDSILKLVEVPIDITATGFYEDIIKFLNNIESYQRVVTIDNITLEDNKDDKDKAKRRVEMKIQGRVFKIKQEPVVESSEEQSGKEVSA